MKKHFIIGLFFMCTQIGAQSYSIGDDYLRISAGADDPLYTTYTAAMERANLYSDKGYKMDYYSTSRPLRYSSDQAGSIFCVWMIDKLVVDRMNKFHSPPVVTASFPDLVMLEYEPFEGLHVAETFFVYSSSAALIEMNVTNASKAEHSIQVFPILELLGDSLSIAKYDSENGAYVLNHHESKWRLISGLYKNEPYPTKWRNIFTMYPGPDSYGGYNSETSKFYLKIKTDYYAEKKRTESLNECRSGRIDYAALKYSFKLSPGASKRIRYARVVAASDKEIKNQIIEVNKLKNINLQQFIDADVRLFAGIPKIEFPSEDEKLIYLGAFNLVRGCMLPPSGKTKYNFYVFSREPKWGWGHGHQVLHESLSMMAYAYLDPVSAQNSQRVYIEQQGKDGLIAYRHGPRGAQTYPHQGKPTTSAPFFSWINWEVYQVSKDMQFLRDAYVSGKKYIDWLIKNRDSDGDGTFEWGPYGIIENVRDWYNVVFQVSEERHLDVDKEDISDELECLDLTLMIINEMRNLSSMADKLNLKNESVQWTKTADSISALVNERMWDNETGFYYHVDKKNHKFNFMGRDLKRQEIIAFLALWAKAAPKERAEKLIQKLTDENKFWRKFGVPTLAADDPFYSPYVDYCCKWNGPVWLLWDYMVFKGLLNYGYNDLARELAGKMLLAASTQLSLNHNFWESYSPDNTVLDSPSNYIWDSILAKMMIDLSLITKGSR